MTYEQLLHHVLTHGMPSADRTGTGTISCFGAPQIKYDLSQGFPLLTTKKIYWKAIVHELLWFISGSTNIKYLKDNGITIWDEWADANGDLGPVYGAQFHRGNQLLQTIQDIRNNPNSRRLVMTLWNPEDLHLQKLHCCHGSVIQFYARNGRLSLHMYQRSADMFLGVPFNIASYALFLEMVAQQTGLQAHELIITFGDCHIYNNHVSQVYEQLSRDPHKYAFPRVEIEPKSSIMDYKYDDIKLLNYQAYPLIKADVSI